MAETKIVPFGKYKGQPVEAMVSDRQYCDWLAQQPWFKDRFGDVYNVIINYGGEPTETPEHNAMQARFLEPAFCLAVYRVAYPDEADYDRAWREDTAHWNTIKDAPDLERHESPLTAKSVQFELDGWDVVYEVKGGLWFHAPKIGILRYGPLGAGVYVECKPTMGDDYPAVLRQVQRHGRRKYEWRPIVMVGSYSGRAVPWASVQQLFKTSGFRLILERNCVG